ncbi:MAG: YlbF family regulator [Finegoldia sp.]|nr:YlbF family regulator [Finegoldia sp.]
MDYKAKAKELADLIKSSSEYRKYKELNDKVYLRSESQRQMIDDFRKQMLDYQLKVQTGENVSQDDINRINSLQAILLSNKDVSDYLQAEVEFSLILKDVYETLDENLRLDDGK